jgi:hypothetical protein
MLILVFDVELANWTSEPVCLTYAVELPTAMTDVFTTRFAPTRSPDELSVTVPETKPSGVTLVVVVELAIFSIDEFAVAFTVELPIDAPVVVIETLAPTATVAEALTEATVAIEELMTVCPIVKEPGARFALDAADRT